MIVPKSYQQEGLSIAYAKRLVLDFGSSNPEVLFFSFLFLSFFPWFLFLGLGFIVLGLGLASVLRGCPSGGTIRHTRDRCDVRAVQEITKGMSQEINEVANYRNFHNRGLVSIQVTRCCCEVAAHCLLDVKKADL